MDTETSEPSTDAPDPPADWRSPIQPKNRGKTHGMRPSNKSRSRNKPGGMGGNPNNGGNANNNRQRLGNIVNRVFESAGPDGKVRGTPQQIIDKYQALARDAQLSGDRVAEQSFLQYSEHYSRMLGEAQAAQQEARQAYERDDRGEERRDGRDDGRPEGRQDRRDEGRRDEGRDGFEPRRDQREPRRDQGFQPQPQPAIASGLATIDVNDGDDHGLIYTPESGGFAPISNPEPAFAPAPVEPALAPEPAPQPAPAPAPQAEAPAPAPEAPAEAVVEAVAEPQPEPAPEPAPAPKRGRPRKKAPKAEEAAAPAADPAPAAAETQAEPAPSE